MQKYKNYKIKYKIFFYYQHEIPFPQVLHLHQLIIYSGVPTLNSQTSKSLIKVISYYTFSLKVNLK